MSGPIGLREAGGAVGGGAVRSACGRIVPGHLEQVGAHGVEAVVVADSFVGLELVENIETGLRTVNHRHCDRVVQRDHGIVRELHQQP